MTTETERPLLALPPALSRLRDRFLAGWRNPRRRPLTLALVLIGALLLIVSCGLLLAGSFGTLPTAVDSPFEQILVGRWQLTADSPRPSGYNVELRFEEGGRLWLVDRATGEGLSATYVFVAEKRVSIFISIGLPSYDFTFDYEGSVLSVETPPDLGFGTLYFTRVSE